MVTSKLYKSCKITMNRKKVKEYLLIAYKQIVTMITQEMKDIVISLKFDSAKRYNKYLFGVNAQYRLKNKTVVRTLGVLEQNDRQTGENLKQQIDHLLSAFGKSVDDIYSNTCDRGRNMTKANGLLISSQEQIFIFDAFLWEENAPLSDLRREMLELAEFGISEDSDDDTSSEK